MCHHEHVVIPLRFVWMSPLESSVLNWSEFQINEETEMERIRIHLFGCPMNWPLKCLWDFNTKSCLDDKLWNCIATLPGYTLFYMTQNWNLTTNKYIATKINKYSRNASGKCKMVIHGQQYIACFLHSIIIAVLLLSRISGTEHVLQFILPTGSEYLYLWILFRKA